MEIWELCYLYLSSICCSLWKWNFLLCCVVCYSCTWSLEVNASHLHGVCRVVGCDVCVVQQTFRARLWLFPFAAGEWDKQIDSRKRRRTTKTQKQVTFRERSIQEKLSPSSLMTIPNQLHNSNSLVTQRDEKAQVKPNQQLESRECVSSTHNSPSRSLIKGIFFCWGRLFCLPL